MYLKVFKSTFTFSNPLQVHIKTNLIREIVLKNCNLKIFYEIKVQKIEKDFTIKYFFYKSLWFK